MELLYDFFEVVVGRQRIDLIAHVVHELLPRDDRVVGRLLPPLWQRRQDELEEARGSREGLREEVGVSELTGRVRGEGWPDWTNECVPVT